MYLARAVFVKIIASGLLACRSVASKRLLACLSRKGRSIHGPLYLQIQQRPCNLLPACTAFSSQVLEVPPRDAARVRGGNQSSGRWLGRAQLRALKRGHLGACSVRRNWYRPLSTSLVHPEGFGKLLHFGKIPKKLGQHLAKFSKILAE